MLLPISFLIENIKSSEEARFFLALRMTSLQKSGYFNLNEVEGFNYRQKLSLVKKLIAKGYINNGHLVSVYRLATHPVTVVVTPDDLSTKKKFKGYIIAATESYIARKQERSRIKKEKERYCNRSKFSQRQSNAKNNSTSSNGIVTEIALSYLSQFLDISVSSIKRYRKHSDNNIYEFNRIYSKWQIWEDEKCTYWPKKKIWVQFKLNITCKVPVIFNKRFFAKINDLLINNDFAGCS